MGHNVSGVGRLDIKALMGSAHLSPCSVFLPEKVINVNREQRCEGKSIRRSLF